MNQIKNSKPSKRRRARELALEILYKDEFGSKNPDDFTFSLAGEINPIDSEIQKYADFLIQGIRKEGESIDSLIQSHCRNWKLNRIAPIDKNIIRIAVFELTNKEQAIPLSVALNEAIEIAKKYGSNDSGSFVNGVLNGITKSLNIKNPA